MILKPPKRAQRENKLAHQSGASPPAAASPEIRQSGTAPLDTGKSGTDPPSAPVMMTVKELTRECKGVSEYYIRTAIKKELFPYVRIGRKVLISREIFIRHLHGETFEREKGEKKQ